MVIGKNKFNHYYLLFLPYLVHNYSHYDQNKFYINLIQNHLILGIDLDLTYNQKNHFIDKLIDPNLT